VRRTSNQRKAQAIKELLRSEGWKVLDEALKQSRADALEGAIYDFENSSIHAAKVIGIDELYRMINLVAAKDKAERSNK
jgi:hypothetical protein